jgi:glycine betaine/choline ABC-type transport system substrate-binding protein
MARTALFVLSFLLASCGSNQRIVVGSKSFTEQVILGEIVAQHLERVPGVTVDRRLNLGGTLLAHEALRTGSIDLYPEYTGTALTAILKQPVSNDAEAVLQTVRDGYRPLGLEWMPPLGFNNTFAIVARSDAAPGIFTLSEAARRPRPWRMGVGYEFLQRADGLDGLVRTYGLRIDGQPASMDLSLVYAALNSRSIEMAAANATDALLDSPGLVVLKDDRRYFPPYQCSVVIRSALLDRNPAVRPALERLSGKIDDSAMRRMNAAVDREHRNPRDVAREFLSRHVR